MFERVVLINLRRRQDRLNAFLAHKEAIGWPLPEPQIFPAIDGDKVGVAKRFLSGGGAWGCLRSHCAVLERAIMDDVKSLLVLEDDITWREDLSQTLSRFMGAVPTEWDQICLGGQHMGNIPARVTDGVVRCENCQRTHAYAIRPAAMKSLLHLWYSVNTHIDHWMGPWQKDWNVYAPAPFLFGQAEGKSDISGRQDYTRYWSSPNNAYLTRLVLVLRAPRHIMDKVRKSGFHTGNWLDGLGYDQGLVMAAGFSPDSPERIKTLAGWVENVGSEAANDQRIPTLWHDQISAEEVRQSTPGIKVVEIAALSLEELKTKFADAV